MRRRRYAGHLFHESLGVRLSVAQAQHDAERMAYTAEVRHLASSVSRIATFLNAGEQTQAQLDMMREIVSTIQELARSTRPGTSGPGQTDDVHRSRRSLRSQKSNPDTTKSHGSAPQAVGRERSRSPRGARSTSPRSFEEVDNSSTTPGRHPTDASKKISPSLLARLSTELLTERTCLRRCPLS